MITPHCTAFVWSYPSLTPLGSGHKNQKYPQPVTPKELNIDNLEFNRNEIKVLFEEKRINLYLELQRSSITPHCTAFVWSYPSLTPLGSGHKKQKYPQPVTPKGLNIDNLEYNRNEIKVLFEEKRINLYLELQRSSTFFIINITFLLSGEHF